MRCGKGQGDNLARIGVKAEAAAVYMVRWYENNANTLFGPPANDASAEVDVAPAGPAMDVGVRPLRCAQRRSTKRTG